MSVPDCGNSEAEWDLGNGNSTSVIRGVPTEAALAKRSDLSRNPLWQAWISFPRTGMSLSQALSESAYSSFL